MFIAGFILGSIVMFLILVIYSCLVVAKRADEQMELELLEDEDEWMF